MYVLAIDLGSQLCAHNMHIGWYSHANCKQSTYTRRNISRIQMHTTKMRSNQRMILKKDAVKTEKAAYEIGQSNKR